MNILNYESQAGIFFPVEELVKGHRLQRINNTTVEECVEYAKLLEKNGYTLCEFNELSAGSDKAYNKNLFYTYKKDKTVLFIFFAGSYNTAYITLSEDVDLPCRFATKETGNKTPAVTQCKLGRGHVYIIELCDGSFILIDGDKREENNSEMLYNFLRKRTPDKERIRISMWLFTHPDIDHISLATGFIKEYSQQVDISAFAYQFTDCDKMQYVYITPSEIKKNIDALEENIREYYPESYIYTLHTGQKLYFSGAEIEVLFTADMLYPYFYTSANDTSAVFRVAFGNGKKALFLGDCMKDSCLLLAYFYGDYLKSDILQLSHHGVIGGEIGLYKLIDPDVCLWSTSEKRFLGQLEKDRFQWCIGEGGCDYNRWLRDNSIRKREHYHLGETAAIEIERDK